jgi:hypothetical protein
MPKKNINWRRELREWSIIIALASYGAIVSFIGWLAEPQNLENLKKLIRF